MRTGRPRADAAVRSLAVPQCAALSRDEPSAADAHAELLRRTAALHSTDRTAGGATSPRAVECSWQHRSTSVRRIMAVRYGRALGLATAQTPGGNNVIAVGGSEGTIDLFADPSHRAFTLRLRGEP